LNWLQTSGLAAAILVGAMASNATAAVIITLTDNGNNTIGVTATGTLNLSALTYLSQTPQPFVKFLNSGSGTVGLIGSTSFTTSNYASSLSSWSAYGTGTYSELSMSGLSGTRFALYLNGRLSIDPAYASGAPISTSGTYLNTSFAGRNISIGTFTSNFSSFGNSDFIQVITRTSGSGEVPEPTSIAIFGLGALGFAYRNRRKQKA
jgi:hypothetical protein